MCSLQWPCLPRPGLCPLRHLHGRPSGAVEINHRDRVARAEGVDKWPWPPWSLLNCRVSSSILHSTVPVFGRCDHRPGNKAAFLGQEVVRGARAALNGWARGNRPRAQQQQPHSRTRVNGNGASFCRPRWRGPAEPGARAAWWAGSRRDAPGTDECATAGRWRPDQQQCAEGAGARLRTRLAAVLGVPCPAPRATPRLRAGTHARPGPPAGSCRRSRGPGSLQTQQPTPATTRALRVSDASTASRRGAGVARPRKDLAPCARTGRQICAAASGTSPRWLRSKHTGAARPAPAPNPPIANWRFVRQYLETAGICRRARGFPASSPPSIGPPTLGSVRAAGPPSRRCACR